VTNVTNQKPSREAHPSEACYAVRFSIKDRPLDDDEDGYDLLHEFTGEIVRKPETDEIIVGKVRAERVDVGEAMNRRWSLMDAFDHSGETEEFYDPLFDPGTYDFREGLGLESFGDVLIVHSIEIVPEYRGLNLGLLVMLQTIKTLSGGCAVVAIKPYPLQFSGNVNKDNEPEFDKGQKKLRAYWQKFGFQRIGKTEYYYCDPTHRLPRAEKLWTPIKVKAKS